MLAVQGFKSKRILPVLKSDFEKEIVQQMLHSEDEYQYRNIRELQFELRMRESIVRSSRLLASSGAIFATFESSHCNPRYWQLTPNGGFMLQRGVKPAAGIRDIFNNGRAYAFECAVAVVIVLYRGILEVLGDAIFNRLFPDLYLYSWHTDSDIRLIHQDGGRPLPGDIQYFNNPDVSPQTPQFQGENVIVVGPNQYYGHGIGIASGEQIINALNRKRKPGATRSAYLMNYLVMLDYGHLQQYYMESPMPYRMYNAAFKGVIAMIGARTYTGR